MVMVYLIVTMILRMVTLDEVEAVHSDVTAEAFAAMDTNMDGVLDEAEVSAAQEAGLLPQSDS